MHLCVNVRVLFVLQHIANAYLNNFTILVCPLPPFLTCWNLHFCYFINIRALMTVFFIFVGFFFDFCVCQSVTPTNF